MKHALQFMELTALLIDYPIFSSLNCSGEKNTCRTQAEHVCIKLVQANAVEFCSFKWCV